MPYIIIKTPRAGDYNHRYIKSKSTRLTDNEIIKKISDVQSSSSFEQNDCIMLTNSVSQKGGRIANESILLGGINTKVINQYQKDNIKNTLTKWQTRLEQLINDINWESENEVATSHILDSWLKQLINTESSLLIKKKESNITKKMIAVLFIVIATILVVLVIKENVFCNFGLTNNCAKNIPVLSLNDKIISFINKDYKLKDVEINAVNKELRLFGDKEKEKIISNIEKGDSLSKLIVFLNLEDSDDLSNTIDDLGVVNLSELIPLVMRSRCLFRQSYFLLDNDNVITDRAAGFIYSSNDIELFVSLN